MSEPNSNDGAPQGSAPSAATIEANQRNGAKSRGPKTERGKAIASGNALRYGLTSRQVVIERLDGDGAQERFAELHETLRERFLPDGDPIVEFRVLRVAKNLWLLQRHDRAEAAMLEEDSLRAAQSDLLGRLRLPAMSDEDIPGNATATEPKSHRVRLLIERLGELEEEIRQDGGLSGESLRNLIKLFGTSDPFAVDCATLWAGANLTDSGSNGQPDAPPSTSQMDQAARLISEKRQQLSKVQAELEELEQQQRAAHLTASGIPSLANAERLWRTRAPINKELEQDLAQLGRRPRHGEKGLDELAPRGKPADAARE